MTLKRGIVKLEAYNKNWKKEYQKEEKILKDILKDKIIEIEHVGSTSIEGLQAKPIIDILIVIKSFDKISEIEKLLKDYGYINHGDHGIPNRCFFTKGPDDARTHYIHFTTPNSDTFYNLIYFKEYLNNHPEYKEKYCKLKNELAEKYADDRPKYTQGKSDFISKVIKLAKEEYK